jgi:pfkB family carbohydrate kinase
MKDNHLPIILEKCKTAIPKTVTTGFDGFVDTVVRILKQKEDSEMPIFFKTIDEFGRYIVAKENNSFSLEIEEISTKLGGNMPILSNALGLLGFNVNCIGALGYPQIHATFKEMPSNCRFYSFTNPGIATAYEFNNGKMMLAQNGLLNILDWQAIKQIIGLETLQKLYDETDLMCLVNWSEINTSTSIWQGILTDILPFLIKKSNLKTAFFDLSDCSNRSDIVIKEALELLFSFGKYANIVLSLNKNEARHLYQVLYQTLPVNTDFAFLGKEIYKKLPIESLLLHSAEESIAFTKKKIYKFENPFFNENPTLSTGAGDNFNAGYCAALLFDLEIEPALLFANAVSALYVQNGKSPALEEVIHFLKSQ